MIIIQLKIQDAVSGGWINWYIVMDINGDDIHLSAASFWFSFDLFTMIKSALFFMVLALLHFSSMQTYAQFVKGEVREFGTEEAIPFAHVYFNSSMRGTTTDENGHFHLLTKDFESQHIVVSCVGYDTWILKGWEDGTTYRIYLKQSSSVLPELYITSTRRKANFDDAGDVSVKTKDIARKRKEKMFLREFLGTTKNGRSCTIKNLHDVDLVYINESATLVGYSDKPLIIYNKSLGYKIRYFLDSFKLDQNNLYYTGNYMFEDDTTFTMAELKKTLKRRREAYEGSRMHFFREMWRKSTYKLEFQILYASSKDGVRLDSLVTDIEHHALRLKPIGALDVNFRDDISRISFVGGVEVPFARSGFFDSEHILWGGAMAHQRVGDLLPFEYWP